MGFYGDDANCILITDAVVLWLRAALIAVVDEQRADLRVGEAGGAQTIDLLLRAIRRLPDQRRIRKVPIVARTVVVTSIHVCGENEMADPSVTVRAINQEILGMGGSDNLVQQIIPSIGLISEATFRPGDENNKFSFRTAGQTVGRLGIFAARKGTLERAVIMLLPESGTPDRVLICITQGFEQAHDALSKLGWSNPLSRPFIEFCLLKHVINRWGPQMLASRKQMALMYIVRARGNELGPFANDGAFVRQVLTEIAGLTADAFSFDAVEAFTFSSGIGEFNTFLRSIGGVLNLQAVYNIDPAHGVLAGGPSGIVKRQFLSGQTSGGPRPAFEYMPVPRWENEWEYPRRETFPNPWRFNYMHNHCMPRYTLHLGIQTS